jgi:hypothetical protein
MFMQVILLNSFENFNSVVWNIFFILAEVWITNLVEKKCKQGISSESKEKNLSKSDLKVLALF